MLPTKRHMVELVSAGYRQPVSAGQPAGAAARDAPPSVVTVGLIVVAAVQLALALLMAISPHAFYEVVGPFGALNAHYIRDEATFYGATGICLLVAVRRVSWRVPVLALMTLQYALHSVNHLVDIGRAHPAWTGYFDFLTLATSTAVLAWLWRTAALERTAAPEGS